MAQKRDLYQEVTSKIVASIEADAKGDDWSLPWHSINRGMPINATSGHEYRPPGLAVCLLARPRFDPTLVSDLTCEVAEREHSLAKFRRSRAVKHLG